VPAQRGGRFGLEIRPMPEHDVTALLADLTECATSLNLELHVQTREPGVACNCDNPYVQTIIATVREVSVQEPVIGREKPGASGRFAPRGQAVIRGQTGIGPHTTAERHYILSIRPYYDALTRLAERLKSAGDGKAGR
jgi:hypothetical protein